MVNNLSARAGLRFNGVDLSVYGNNLTNAHPLMFEARDIATGPGVVPTDLLYFGRGVRPRTVGVTATYRY
ncbi:MAG: iron complex outerrane recepter protein [Gammaproteobacteria bacterium]|nr:iron complex outerrane recepter protein [Gammaproteobacteria bacterium]